MLEIAHMHDVWTAADQQVFRIAAGGLLPSQVCNKFLSSGVAASCGFRDHQSIAVDGDVETNACCRVYC